MEFGSPVMITRFIFGILSLLLLNMRDFCRELSEMSCADVHNTRLKTFVNSPLDWTNNSIVTQLGIGMEGTPPPLIFHAGILSLTDYFFQ